MKVFTRDYRIQHYNSRAWDRYMGGLKPCVFDIEATGLSPARSKVIMTAMLTEIESGVRITQFLAENPYEEERVIEATMDSFKEEGIDYLITFNGKRYDIPFVKTRIEKLIMPYELDMYDFDVYRFVRKETILPRLMKSLSQSMVEQYCGIRKDRKDTIDGKESIALFEKYALTGDAVTEKIILTHNREDVLQLYRILCILGADDWGGRIKRDSFDEAMADYGFPVRCGLEEQASTNNDGQKLHSGIVMSATPVLKKNGNALELRITGAQIGNAVSAAFWADDECDVSADFRSTTRSFEITVPVQCHENSAYVELARLGLGGLESGQGSISDITASDNYVNGFLILSEDGKPDYVEINRLAAAIVRNVSERI